MNIQQLLSKMKDRTVTKTPPTALLTDYSTTPKYMRINRQKQSIIIGFQFLRVGRAQNQRNDSLLRTPKTRSREKDLVLRTHTNSLGSKRLISIIWTPTLQNSCQRLKADFQEMMCILRQVMGWRRFSRHTSPWPGFNRRTSDVSRSKIP